MLRFSDKQYPGLAACNARRHAMYRTCGTYIDNATIYPFQARSFQKATPYSPYPKLGPWNPTSHSYMYKKSAQGLATSQATKPPDEIVHIGYILFTYGLQTLCVSLWRPGEMLMRASQRVVARLYCEAAPNTTLVQSEHWSY